MVTNLSKSTITIGTIEKGGEGTWDSSAIAWDDDRYRWDGGAQLPINATQGASTISPTPKS